MGELNMNAKTPLVVREREAGQLLGVSVAALRRWRREGRGPAFVRLERCIGYRIDDLETFVNANRVTQSRTQEGDERATA